MYNKNTNIFKGAELMNIRKVLFLVVIAIVVTAKMKTTIRDDLNPTLLESNTSSLHCI